MYGCAGASMLVAELHTVGKQTQPYRHPPALGGLIENFALGELARQLSWAEEPVTLWHYRDRDGVEVDAVLERASGEVVGVEVKAAETVRSEDFRGLRHLARRFGDRFHAGFVLYAGEQSLPFGDRMRALPLVALWRGALTAATARPHGHIAESLSSWVMGPMGANLIAEARGRAGLTQRELAERAGTTQSSIARWESGRTKPSFANVVRLLRLCGFVLDVRLEAYNDGLRDDWAQAQRVLRRTPDEIVAGDRRLHALYREGQQALAEARAASG